jgi:heme exporter protein C
MGKSAIDAAYLWPLLIAVIGFSLLFGGVVLMRMRALIAEAQVEARLRRQALDDDVPIGVVPAPAIAGESA